MAEHVPSLRVGLSYAGCEATMPPDGKHLPPNWQRRLCVMIGCKADGAGEPTRLLDAWSTAEGGTAQWNPLNTTLMLQGATNYNRAGVKNYTRATEGVCALALTLVNGFYNGIVADMQAGAKTAERIVGDNEAEFRTWGTNPATILSVLGQ